MSTFFIIGTDTDAGKTYISTKLIEAFEKQNINSICLKPIASGQSKTSNICEDVESIIKAYKNKYAPNDINLISFKEAVAPHILAKKYSKNINIDAIQNFIIERSRKHSITIIEGAGGLLTPYSESITQLDLIKKLNIPVLLIVNIKVGCINHALLTLNELRYQNIKCLGWISNSYKNSDFVTEQIKTIENLSDMKCLLHIDKDADYNYFLDFSKTLIFPAEKA